MLLIFGAVASRTSHGHFKNFIFIVAFCVPLCIRICGKIYFNKYNMKQNAQKRFHSVFYNYLCTYYFTVWIKNKIELPARILSTFIIYKLKKMYENMQGAIWLSFRILSFFMLKTFINSIIAFIYKLRRS